MRTLKKLKKLYWRSSGETLKKLWWNFDETLLKKFQEIFKKKKNEILKSRYIHMIRKFMSAEATESTLLQVITHHWSYYKNAMFQDFHLACRPNFSTKECFPCLCKQIPNPSKLQLILQTSQEEAANIKNILLKLCKHSKQHCMFLCPFSQPLPFRSPQKNPF